MSRSCISCIDTSPFSALIVPGTASGEREFDRFGCRTCEQQLKVAFEPPKRSSPPTDRCDIIDDKDESSSFFGDGSIVADGEAELMVRLGGCICDASRTFS